MELKPGYRRSEIGEVPAEWQVTPLGSFVALRRGHDLTESQRSQGEVPVMSAAGLYGFHDTAKVKGPGVVLGRSGASFGQAHYCATDFWPHNTALYVTDFFHNYRLFAYYFLKSIDFSRHNSGGAQQSLNRNFIAPILVAIPPRNEQEAIAAALTDADALIESLEQLLAKKRLLKQGTMQELLTGKKRLPGFAATWTLATFGEIFDITAGGDVDPSRTVPCQDTAHPYPVYSNALTNFGLYGYCSYSAHQAASITVTARGTLGCAVFRDQPFTAIGRVLVLVPRSVADGRFFAELINSQVDFAIESTGVPQLTAPQIARYSLSIPTPTEQSAIADILSDIDAEIAALEAKLTKARYLKQAMMQELLTGRIRLVPPVDQSGATGSSA
jgi:type I restriction enzyme S subunit